MTKDVMKELCKEKKQTDELMIQMKNPQSQLSGSQLQTPSTFIGAKNFVPSTMAKIAALNNVSEFNVNQKGERNKNGS